MEKRSYTMVVQMNNVEIRNVEMVEKEFEVTEKGEAKVITSRYLDIKADDENCERIYLKDKNVDNLENYHRGDIGTFTLRIACEEEFKKKYDITVISFKKNK